jgi:hypothetical protein
MEKLIQERFYRFVALAAVMLMTLTACPGPFDEDDDKRVAVIAIKIEPESATLAIGETLPINVLIAPADATDITARITSDNPAVATVNISGIVTAVSAGTATITATSTDGGKTATCRITVTGGGSNGGSSAGLVTYLYTSNEGGVTYNYEYDNQNRITKVTISGGVLAGVMNTTYPSANTIRYDHSSKGYYYILTKGSNGYVTGYEGNLSGFEMKQTLDYVDGFLSKTTTNTGLATVVNTYTWSNGRLNTIEYAALGLAVNKTTFSYGTTPNKESSISPWVTSHLGNTFTPTAFCGKMSPNLVTSETWTNPAKSVTYRYETNAEGYVTKVYTNENSAAEALLYEVRYK